MDKKTFILTTLSVVLGLVIGGLVLAGLNTLRNDHKKLEEVVTFLNSQIQAAQRAQTPVAASK